LHKRVRDPRLINIAITSVDVSPDLRNAKAYYVLLDSEELLALSWKILNPKTQNIYLLLFAFPLSKYFYC